MPRRRVCGRASETSRLTTVACRIAVASRASPRAPIHASGSARSPRDGSSCRTRTHRPCHAGPRSGCRTLGTRPDSGASLRAPSPRWGRRGRLSPSLLRDPACGLSRRSRGPPRRGSGARAQQPCAVHAHDHPRASPATIAVAVDGYRTCWIVTGGTPRRCSAPRLDPRQSMVAFRGSGSRVVSRITIERFRLSSDPEAGITTTALPPERERSCLHPGDPSASTRPESDCRSVAKRNCRRIGSWK